MREKNSKYRATNTAVPLRVCFDCIHYEACQMWNIGSLLRTDASHCVNFKDGYLFEIHHAKREADYEQP